MNLGFVGTEQEWRQLESILTPDPRFQVVAFLPESDSESTTTDRFAAFDADRLRGARRYSDFESLLSDHQIAAVVLGGPIVLRPERLRRIAQDGRSCLCFHPADLGAIFYHEVAMIAADTRAILLPWLPGALHPAWRELLRLHQSGSFGAPRQVTMEHAGPLRNGRLLIAGPYAQAVSLLTLLVGAIDEVSATGDADSGRLVVHHHSTAGVIGEIRLIATANGPNRWTIHLDAERGHAELIWAHGLGGPGVLHWSGPDGTGALGPLTPESTNKILIELDRAIAHQSTDCPIWSDATQAAELADAAWLSLERRRAVDVYHENRNELASFKGRMTSVGCGLIWLTIVAVFLIASAEGLHIPGAGWLAAAMVLVWLAFLFLQVLRWVVPTDQAGPASQRPSRLSYLFGLFLALFLTWLFIRMVVLG